MASLTAKATAQAFRLLMMGNMNTPERLVRHCRRLTNIVRPPAMLPKGVSVRKTTIANEPAVPPGIPAVCVSVENPTSTVLYIHGGAFICGQFHTYASICGQLAHRLNARVFWIDYRMAPEFPFPAATDDAFNAYSALVTDYPHDPIAVIGDSAGGNITLSTLLRARDALADGEHPSSLRMPACAVAMSAATDLTGKLPSREANAKSDAILNPKFINTAVALYLDGHDPEDPYVSPAFGDFEGLPPLMLTVSDIETVRDDSYLLASRAREAGLTVELLNRPDILHAWPALYSVLPEARKDMTEIARFMRSHLEAPVGKARPKPKLSLARAS